MKHFLTFLFVLSVLSVSAQRFQNETVIGRLKLPEGLAAELTYKIYSIVDTTFYFTFKDMQSKERESFATIRFTRLADVESLYFSLMSIVNEKKKRESRMFYIGTNEVGIRKSRLRSSGVRLSHGTSFIDLSKSQIEILFGKESR